jgi:hypothetical protein
VTTGLLDRARAAARPQLTGSVVGAMGLTLSVERAGAVAETGPTRVDAQLGAALERVRAVLAP